LSEKYNFLDQVYTSKSDIILLELQKKVKILEEKVKQLENKITHQHRESLVPSGQGSSHD